MKLKKIKRLMSIFLIVFIVTGVYIFRDDLSNIFIADKSSRVIEEKKSEDNNLLDQAKDENKVTIMAAGDVMCHMPQARAAYNNGKYDFNENYKFIKPYLDKVDLGLVNFETVTLGNSRGISGYPAFNSPVEILDALSYAGFDIINASNNHILDRGEEGLSETVKNIKNRGLDCIGSSLKGDKKHLIKEINNIKIGFLSYSYGFNGNENRFSKDQLELITNKIDREKIHNDIDFMKRENVDFIITYIHWGEEYKRSPNNEQKTLAKEIFAWGGDVILGSHPHVVQGSESFEVDGKKKFVIYSMGNFISNQRRETLNNPYTEDGLMVKMELIKNKEKNTLGNIETIPTWVNKYNNLGTHYEIIPVKDALEGNIDVSNIESIREKLNSSLERTLNSMNIL